MVEQLQSGQPVVSVLDAMLASGWEREVARSALTSVGQSVELGAASQAAWLAPEPMPRIDAQGKGSVWANDRDVRVLLQLQHPSLSVLNEVLSLQECVALIELARPRLSRSETVAQTPVGSEVHEARTSQGMFFSRGENELCTRIEARIAKLIDWPVDHGEGLQVLRYMPGAEYQPHFDYFDVNHGATPNILKRGGQRVATLVMYLNTPQAGGATTFPDAGLSVQAHAGGAVFFSYAKPDPSSLSLHGGAPVISGEKWVATKWLRQSVFA